MNESTIWYHPRVDHICALENGIAEAYFEVRGEWYHYAVPRDDEIMKWLGWIKIGNL